MTALNKYEDYSLKIVIDSPVSTPWQSDTIMGHLAWSVRLRDGESGLKSFLEPWLAGDPPFIVSDGFPNR